MLILLSAVANIVLYRGVVPPFESDLLKIIMAFLYHSTSILLRSLYQSTFLFGNIFHLIPIHFDIPIKPIFPCVFMCFLFFLSKLIGWHCSISNSFDTCLSMSSSASGNDYNARRDMTSLIQLSLSLPCTPSSGMTLIIFSLSTPKKKLSENKR